MEYLQRSSRPLMESQKDWLCSTGRYDETQPLSYRRKLPPSVAGQSPAILTKSMPVILPCASKPIRRLAASPRGKISFTR